MRALCTEFLSILRGIVNELTDQSAYQRHLLAHGAVHSPAEWRRFQDHCWTARSHRGRCC